jgi:2-oxoglutarate ferredoxin oxidoreductase subunit beta
VVSEKELNTPAVNTWCPGCGNFAIENGIKRAIAELGLDPSEVILVSGIGCHGKITNYVKANSFHTIHGRVPPSATGIYLSNHKMKVIGFSGDGDAYAIGIAHLIHTATRNLNFTYIVHNNKVFGLTTGQTTPTSEQGFKTKSTPFGKIEKEINPLQLALVSGATFVARVYSGEFEQLIDVFKKGIQHRGFAFIDVLQPCFTFFNTYQLYSQKVYKLEKEGHDTSDIQAAMAKTKETDKVPIGIFYQEKRPIYTESLPQISRTPLVKQDIKNINIKNLLKEFK